MEEVQLVNRNLARYNSLTEKLQNNWDDYEFFLEFIFENISYYYKLIGTFEGYVYRKLMDNNDIIFNLCKQISNAIDNYMKGKIIFAYENMKDAFTYIKHIIKRKSAYRKPMSVEYGFKARLFDSRQQAPTREEMFHIPFEKRQIVQDNRYSIHGLPSIYLGRSIYDCYIELGEPPLDNFWVSMFSFTQDAKNVLSANHINLIDLTYNNYEHIISLELVKNNVESYTAALDRLIDDIILWPLYMVCSIPCKYPNAAFKHEYIIPQIMYQLCSDYNEYVGIKYTSTKRKRVNNEIYQYALDNYAIPAHDIKKSGFCPKLVSQLVLSTPITMNHCIDLNIEASNGLTPNGLPILSDMHYTLKNDSTVLIFDKMTMHFDKIILNLL